MDDDIGEMVRSLYGPAASAASIEGPSVNPPAATPSEAAEKVIVPDITMTENVTDDLAGGGADGYGGNPFSMHGGKGGKMPD